MQEMHADSDCSGAILLMKKLRLRETSNWLESGEVDSAANSGLSVSPNKWPTAPYLLLASLQHTAQSGSLSSPPPTPAALGLLTFPTTQLAVSQGHLLSDKHVDKAHVPPREPSSFRGQRKFQRAGSLYPVLVPQALAFTSLQKPASSVCLITFIHLIT